MSAKHDTAHYRALRKRLKPLVESGRMMCWRCGQPILPGEKWDLGHTDGGGIAGPEHASENRRAGGRIGAAIRNGRHRVASQEW
jgi:hypothetical protein